MIVFAHAHQAHTGPDHTLLLMLVTVLVLVPILVRVWFDNRK